MKGLISPSSEFDPILFLFLISSSKFKCEFDALTQKMQDPAVLAEKRFPALFFPFYSLFIDFT